MTTKGAPIYGITPSRATSTEPLFSHWPYVGPIPWAGIAPQRDTSPTTNLAGEPTSSPDSFRYPYLLAARLQQLADSQENTVRFIALAAKARRAPQLYLDALFKALGVQDPESINPPASPHVSFQGSYKYPFQHDPAAHSPRITFVTPHDLANHMSTTTDQELLRSALHQLEISHARFSGIASTMTRQLVGEPEKLIPASELAAMLQLSEEAVRLRLQSGKLIAILSAGRERGRGYPAFQAWEGIAGAPLERILLACGYEGPGKAGDAALAFQFFISRNDLLGGFTPVEVLTGVSTLGALDEAATGFLAKPHEERVEFVIGVAQTTAAAIANAA
jgi:hypothetical protein